MAVTQTDTRIWKFSAAADSVSTKEHYRFLRWVGATAAGHNLIVTDGSGNEVFVSEANGANYVDDCPLGYSIGSLTVASMGSGALYAYTGRPNKGVGITSD